MSTKVEIASLLASLSKGIQVNPLPEHPGLDKSVPHAPSRNPRLTEREFLLAIKNALRYFPEEHHEILGKEFIEELKTYGHIYMYRFRPVHYEMRAYPIECYPAKNKHAAAIQLMIMNNLNPEVKIIEKKRRKNKFFIMNNINFSLKEANKEYN